MFISLFLFHEPTKYLPSPLAVWWPPWQNVAASHHPGSRLSLMLRQGRKQKYLSRWHPGTSRRLGQPWCRHPYAAASGLGVWLDDRTKDWQVGFKSSLWSVTDHWCISKFLAAPSLSNLAAWCSSGDLYKSVRCSTSD